MVRPKCGEQADAPNRVAPVCALPLRLLSSPGWQSGICRDVAMNGELKQPCATGKAYCPLSNFLMHGRTAEAEGKAFVPGFPRPASVHNTVAPSDGHEARRRAWVFSDGCGYMAASCKQSTRYGTLGLGGFPNVVFVVGRTHFVSSNGTVALGPLVTFLQ